MRSNIFISAVVGMLLMACGAKSGGDTGSHISPNIALYPPSYIGLQKAFGLTFIKIQWVNDANNSDLDISNVIQRKESGAAEFADIATVGADVSTYNDSAGLINGKTYVYRIKVIENSVTADPVYTVEKSILFSDAIVVDPNPPNGV